MKLYKSIFAASLGALISLTGCSDEFAEMNTSKSAIGVAEPAYLFSMAQLDFQTNEYTYWFYNSKILQGWSQMGASSSGYTSGITELGNNGGQGSQYISVLKIRNELQNYIDTHEDSESYLAYRAAADVLAIYTAILDVDMLGDRPYTEACMLKFGGPLTPKYDSVETLFDLWLQNLNDDIAVFQRDDQEMPNKSTQDLIYKGDMSKWAKLANSIKLKIAVRLYNQNKEKAISIAEEVVNANVGYIDSRDDDMIFAKATNYVGSENQDYLYNTGNGLNLGYASADVINFMLKTKDPRVRFIYTKNSFNAKVVQGFIDDGRYDDLPTLVKQNIIRDANGNFQEWGGMGEPWVRYIGIPLDEFEASVNASSPYYKEYFSPGERYNLKSGDATKGYTPLSSFQEEMVRGRVDFTLPTLPDGPVVQDTEDRPWYGMYMTAGEVNLYLAELKLLGASLPKSAEEYYSRGVRFSVEAYDYCAEMNKIPYYGNTWLTTYAYEGSQDESIELKDGEVDDMLATEGVKLQGSTLEQLEKVYLQQLMHFSMYPDDQYVTARRSGVPMKNSTLLPFHVYSQVSTTAIPRRFSIGSPSETDKMYEQILTSLKNQGFTPGVDQSGAAYNTTGSVLNTERIWYDKNAPQWGEGPKL